MGLFDIFGGNKNEPREITLQGIQSNSDKLDKASTCFLQCFGSDFTGTSEGHIVTDIAGASALAGLLILRSTDIDLSQGEPGNVILGEEINQKQEPVLRYLAAIASNMGVDPNGDSDKDAIDKYKPLFDTIELTQKLERTFYEACAESNIQKLYYPIVAALTAMKLVGAGMEMNLLDPRIGKDLAMFYTVAGSKTIPYNVK